jgi:(1->4)-alpha-D-glucan 1-alpha-D-glucosylmutase
LEQKHDGRIKLFVTARALRLRRERPDLFTGGYVPLEVTGARAGHLFCFARVAEASAAIVAVPRLVATLLRGADQMPIGPDIWGDTAIVLPTAFPSRRWADVFTGEVIEASDDHRLPAAAVLGSMTVALLAP